MIYLILFIAIIFNFIEDIFYLIDKIISYSSEDDKKYIDN